MTKNKEKLRDIFGFSRAVILHDAAPFDEGIDILHKLRDVGFKTPFVYGGALRDHLLGKSYTDIDISVDICDVSIQRPKLKDLDNLVSSVLPNWKLLRTFGIDIPNRMYFHYETKGSLWETKLDMAFETPQRDINGITFMSDAPFNALVMNHEGQIWAHPLFEKHVEHEVYSPSIPLSRRGVQDLNERFNHLAEKYNDLKMIFPEDLPRNLRPSWTIAPWPQYIKMKKNVSKAVDNFFEFMND